MIAIPDFSRLRVLVVGDVMLDRYWHGRVERISQEAPVPVVAVDTVDERPGGAANVALGCAALGAQVHLASVIGADSAGQRLDELIGAACQVSPHLDVDPGMRTTVKLRVLGQGQQMIRIDTEDAAPSSDAVGRMMRHLPDLIEDADIVIASDYAKGALGRVQDLIQMATAAGKPVFVDPKGSDWSKYAGAAMVKPNAVEISAATRQERKNDQLCAAADLAKALRIGHVLTTYGVGGMNLVDGLDDYVSQAAYPVEVADVTGAGDTVMAVVACMRAAGRPWSEAMYLASKAAGIIVGRVGAGAVTVEELRRA